MDPAPAKAPTWFTRHRLDLLLFLSLFLCFAWFSHREPGWNVNSRLALTLAWAETGSPIVDRYVALPKLYTQDLAQYNGHLYSDKSIGTSLLGVPAAWTVRALENLADVTFSMDTRRWIITALTISLTGALAGVLLARLLRRITRVSPSTAFHLSAAVMLGTMLLLYSSLFMSYLPATACLLACLLATEKSLDDPRPRRALIAGLFGGLTILMEYIYGAAIVAIGIYWLIQLWKPHRHAASNPMPASTHPGADTAPAPGPTPLATNSSTETLRPARLTCTAAYALGGLLGILPFLIYTLTIFGRLGVPYEYHLMPEFRQAMARGFMGATRPSPTVLLLITLHPFRGLFLYSPILLLGLIGLIQMLRHPSSLRNAPFWTTEAQLPSSPGSPIPPNTSPQTPAPLHPAPAPAPTTPDSTAMPDSYTPHPDPRQRPLALLSLILVAFYLLFNSAYYMWWGGWSFAPRRLAPAIPFLALGLPSFTRTHTRRQLLLLTAAIGIIIHTLVAATEPQLPDGGWQAALLQPDLTKYHYPSPLLTGTLPRLIANNYEPTLLSGIPPLWAYLGYLTFTLSILLRTLQKKR